VTSKKSLVTVTIGNEEYTLKSDRSPEYTRAVADHVNGKLEEVLASGSIIESHKAAVLAALAVTDELFQARQTQKDLTDRLTALARKLSRLLPPAKRQSGGSGAFASPPDEK
jgi:cell division protein ZapA